LNKKWFPYLLIIVLGAAVVIIKTCASTNKTTSKTKGTNEKNVKSEKVDRDHGFDRRISYLEYSKHAKCRMECRHITQAEVEQIMQNGMINYNKSDLQNSRCPRYAIEGDTNDDQHVRIVFAQCNEKTEVVTVIDLNTEWSCDCPGDDHKYINRN
jgi:hypothetical protein